jgi:hypothetical protein
MNDQTYAMIFFENEGRVSQVFLNRDPMEFKDQDGVMYAFTDLDEGLIFYEELVRKINSDIDWMSVQP